MTRHAHPDEHYYDHLPDGTIVGEISFEDGEKLADLMVERMTPENLTVCLQQLRVNERTQQ